ncbi:hypothetical protein C0J52_16243 [Blattella germanica]|nr:hypothetical protein C0J52_16243 [Blattella germanica]
MLRCSGLSHSIIKERLLVSVWVHERQHTQQIMAQIMGIFQEIFNKAPPRKATLLEFSIGKDAILLLTVLKTGQGVEGTRHEKERVLESLLR